MGNILVINSVLPEVRVALLENGVLTELYVEREREKGSVGNIYRGRVVRVLPGLEAAFVDIAQEKAAFLYMADTRPLSDTPNGDSLDLEEDAYSISNNEPVPPRPTFREGQEIMVQVAKDPLGTKGARLTTHISIPGRLLVYMPNVRHVGISRRIQDEHERERLRQLMEQIRPSEDDGGFIVRTVAEGSTENQLRQDMEF